MIRMDFSKCLDSDKGKIGKWLCNNLDERASRYGIVLEYDDHHEKFDQLIRKLSDGEKIIVPIDEYDAPLSNNIGNMEIEGRGRFSETSIPY